MPNDVSFVDAAVVGEGGTHTHTQVKAINAERTMREQTVRIKVPKGAHKLWQILICTRCVMKTQGNLLKI